MPRFHEDQPLSEDDEHLLWHALQLSDETRQVDYLREACSDDLERQASLIWYLRLQSSAADLFRVVEAQPADSLAKRRAENRVNAGCEGALSCGQIGDFELIQVVGSGGMGTVFLARDTRLARMVALKLPRLDVVGNPELRQRFLKEARMAAKLEHAGLVSILEVGTAGPLHYIASQWCRGGDLASWLLQNPGPHSADNAARFVAAICDAIAYCHRQGVVHLDCKPSNIMLAFHAEAHRDNTSAGSRRIP